MLQWRAIMLKTDCSHCRHSGLWYPPVTVSCQRHPPPALLNKIWERTHDHQRNTKRYRCNKTVGSGIFHCFIVFSALHLYCLRAYLKHSVGLFQTPSPMLWVDWYVLQLQLATRHNNKISEELTGWECGQVPVKLLKLLPKNANPFRLCQKKYTFTWCSS